MDGSEQAAGTVEPTMSQQVDDLQSLLRRLIGSCQSRDCDHLIPMGAAAVEEEVRLREIWRRVVDLDSQISRSETRQRAQLAELKDLTAYAHEITKRIDRYQVVASTMVRIIEGRTAIDEQHFQDIKDQLERLSIGVPKPTR